MRVLIVEDSEESRILIQHALAPSGIEMACAATYKEATLLLKEKFDLAIIDIGLPDGDGMSLVTGLKSNPKTANLPIFFLTGNMNVATKVQAFDLGVDDYLVKPIDPFELRARVSARLKKSQKNGSDQNHFGGLYLNPPLLQAKIVDGKKEELLDLTAKEFKILNFLVSGEGKIYSRTELVEAIWGNSVHVLDRTVDSHICAIRRKLGDLSDYVESVPGSGYRFRISEKTH